MAKKTIIGIAAIGATAVAAIAGGILLLVKKGYVDTEAVSDSVEITVAKLADTASDFTEN